MPYFDAAKYRNLVLGLNYFTDVCLLSENIQSQGDGHHGDGTKMEPIELHPSTLEFHFWLFLAALH